MYGGIVGLKPAGGIGVCLLCYVLSGTDLCDGLITHPEESYQECDGEASIKRRPWPTMECHAMGEGGK